MYHDGGWLGQLRTLWRTMRAVEDWYVISSQQRRCYPSYLRADIHCSWMNAIESVNEPGNNNGTSGSEPGLGLRLLWTQAEAEEGTTEQLLARLRQEIRDQPVVVGLPGIAFVSR